MYPKELKYTKTHEWAKKDDADDALVTVGVSFYAQQEIRDVVYVELPPVGAKTVQGEPFGVIESVKAAFDLYAPVSGEVVAINESLEQSPELVNESSYAEGWMLKIKMTDPNELEKLLNSDEYQQLIEREGHK